MSSDRRNRVLNRVRAALGPAAKPPLPAPVLPRPRELETLAARVERFTERLESVGGRVRRVASLEEAAEALARIVAEREVRSLVRSDAARLDPLVAALPASVSVGSDPFDREALLAADAGLTGAQGAIAETGTLVLDSRAERHRLASLLPPLHVAVVDAASIVATIGDALARFGAPPPPALSFITGPSRTADIELELVVGVHGPKALEVILVDASGSDGA